MNLPNWIYAVYRVQDGIVSPPNGGYLDEASAKKEQEELNETADTGTTWLIAIIWVEESRK